MRPTEKFDPSLLAELEGSLSGWILSSIQILDRFGASTWNHLSIAIGAAMLLFMIRFVTKDAMKVRWWALLNAVFLVAELATVRARKRIVPLYQLIVNR